MDRRLAAFSLVLVLVAGPLASRPLAGGEPGYKLKPLFDPSSTVTWTLSNEEVLVLGDETLLLYDADGTLLRRIAHLGYGIAGPAGLTVDPTETLAVTAHITQGGVHEVDLVTGAFTTVTPTRYVPEGGFVFETPDTLLYPYLDGVGTNEVRRLHLSDGSTELLLALPDTVLQVDLDAAGNLYVAYVSERRPGGKRRWNITRFSAAQVATGSLSLEEGQTVLEGRVDLRSFDVTDDGSRIFFSEDQGLARGGLYQLEPGQAPALLADLDVDPAFWGVQFVPGPGPAAFLPFQPQGGGGVYVVGTGPSRSRVQSLRPRAAVSGPGLTGTGPFDLELTLGPPGGFALVYLGPSATLLSPELVLQLGVPLFVGLAPSTLVRAPGVHALDASGAATIPYVNSTGTPGAWALQVVLLDASLRLAGSSTVATL